MKPRLMYMMGRIKPGYRKTTCKKGTIEVVEFVEICTVFLIKFFHKKPSGKGERLIVLHAG